MYQTHHFPPLWFPDIIEKKEKKRRKWFWDMVFLFYQFSTSQLTTAFPIITLTVSLEKNNDTGNKKNSLKQKKIMIRKDIYLFQIKQGCFLLVSSNRHHGWWPLYMWVWGGLCVQTGPCSTLWCHTVEGRGPGYLHHTGFWVLWGI